MKLLVFITLALATLIGSQGFVLSDQAAQHQAEADTKLSKLVDEWEEYVENVTNAMQRKFNTASRTELVGELRVLYQEASYNFSQHLESLKDEVPEETKEALSMAFNLVVKVVEKGFLIQKYLDEVLKPAAKKFFDTLEAELSVYVDPVLEKMEPSLDALHRGFHTRVEALETGVAEKVLPHLEPLTAQLRSHIRTLPELQEHIRPHVHHIQQKLKEEVDKAHKNLQPYLDNVRDVVQNLQHP